MLTLDPQRQRAIERRKLMRTIAKTETQIAALRRFAALPPETVAAIKEEASAMGRRAYDALEGNAADWQVIRTAHDRLNRVIAQHPLSAACLFLDLHLRCVEVQRQYKETMAQLQRMEPVTGLTEHLYEIGRASCRE